MDLHEMDIILKGSDTSIKIDGHEINGITRMSMDVTAEVEYVVNISLYVSSVRFISDVVNVEVDLERCPMNDVIGRKLLEALKERYE